MGKNIDINWDNVKDLSTSTLENFQKFEESRQRIKKIVESIPECWEGLDANAFEYNLGNFAEILKEDTQYFEYLSKYFDKSSKVIGGIVETYDEKFGRFERDSTTNNRNTLTRWYDE